MKVSKQGSTLLWCHGRVRHRLSGLGLQHGPSRFSTFRAASTTNMRIRPCRHHTTIQKLRLASSLVDYIFRPSRARLPEPSTERDRPSAIFLGQGRGSGLQADPSRTSRNVDAGPAAIKDAELFWHRWRNVPRPDGSSPTREMTADLPASAEPRRRPSVYSCGKSHANGPDRVTPAAGLWGRRAAVR